MESTCGVSPFPPARAEPKASPGLTRALPLLLLAGLLLGPPDAAARQATGTITGTVTAEGAGQVLSGAVVTVEGTQVATFTDQEGRFTLARVPAGSHEVRVRLLGYGERRVAGVSVQAGQVVTLDLQLEPQAVELAELVVTGYGEQRRADITGAVVSISSDDFIAGPARNAASLIAGKIPGLAVTTPSGNPRAGSQISLRGQTTIQGSTNPLVLIDGVPGGLSTVAPEDIESITVLKDGSAAAIYGSRASNGVILISTKRHDGGAPTLRYDAYTSYQTIYNSPDFLSAADYRRLIGEGVGFEDYGYETDWLGQLLREPVSHRHNLSISGGTAETSYNAAFDWEDAQGIFRRSDQRVTTARASIRHAMFDGRLDVDANLLSRSASGFQPNLNFFNGIWRQALIRNPTDRVYDDTGGLLERGTYMYFNPVGLLREDHGQFEDRTQRLHGTISLRPARSLRLSMMGGASRGSGLTGRARTFQHISTTFDGNYGIADRGTSSNLDRVLELTGTFNQNFGGHNVTLLGGYSYNDFLFESFNASNRDFPTDLFGFDQLQQGDWLNEGRASMSSSKSDYKVIGFFSRVNYSWQNRVTLMGSVRYEGNSRFGADHEWGLFPAVSAGWRLSEETFMDRFDFINDLRVRAGYGVTGIAPTSSYLSLASYSYGGRFLYDGRWVRSLAPARNANPNLRWEEKQELNLGLDFSVMDFRLSGGLDVYRRDTRDMLYNYQVPVPPNLTGSMLANVGHMRNNGIEARLEYDVVRGSGFQWTTGVNGSTNTNRLVTLSDETFQPGTNFFNSGGTGEPIQTFTHRVEIGGPIGNFWGWKSVDIDDNGEWVIENPEGELVPIRQAGEEDKQVLGNGVPKYYLAWNNMARYGRFDFSVNMRGAFGFQILNFNRMFYENPTITHYNMLRSAFEPVYGKRTVNYDLAYVSYYVEDGDYWKVDNATLGYTFGPGTLGRVSGVLSNARVYVSGRNLLTLTGYKGMDPEVSTSGLSPATDSRDQYPTTRMFTFGITATF